jgi:MinD-like ATPase involved in chromosome partitioning or flagellar assembly
MTQEGAKYLLYEEPLGVVSGVQTQVPVVLSEYPLRTGQDVNTYLALLKTMPDYFDSLIEFEKKKAEAGLFMADYAVDEVMRQCNAFLDMGENNYLISTFVERVKLIEELTEEEKSDYMEKNALMIRTYVMPAYRKLTAALQEMRESEGRDLIIPAEQYGVRLLSIGFLVDADKPVLWRGSMASNALNQLITQADWGELDYFLIDMPPGTSDIHLTLVQTLGITGVVVVSTPQQVALADARKGIAMFMGDKVNVPVLGLVENMAWFTPAAHPQERYYIFGREGAKMLASELNVPLLGQIPLVADICEQADLGSPIALADSVEGEAFMQLADNVVAAVDSRNESLPPTEKVNVTKK